jgi:hypothetical protein
MEELRVTKNREYSAHPTLMRIARWALNEAKTKKVGSWDNTLVAITFSALALEALANAAGNIAAQDDSDFGPLDFAEKVKRLCSILTVRWDSNKEPWSTVIWLHKFRNKIAHPKPEFLFEEAIMNSKAYEATRHRWPKSSLEKLITVGNAQRSVDQVARVQAILRERIDPVLAGFLYADSMSTQAAVARP